MLWVEILSAGEMKIAVTLNSSKITMPSFERILIKHNVSRDGNS